MLELMLPHRGFQVVREAAEDEPLFVRWKVQQHLVIDAWKLGRGRDR
jgi:hypothetical protein